VPTFDFHTTAFLLSVKDLAGKLTGLMKSGRSVRRNAAFMLILSAVLCVHSMYLFLMQASNRARKTGSYFIHREKLDDRHIPGGQQFQVNASAESHSGLSAQNVDFEPYEYNALRTHAPIAIFYNIYIPDDTAGEKRALEIIADQMQQIKESFATQGGKLTLYYVTIGKQLDASFIEKHCGETLECQLVQHYAKGFEEVTLQRVSDFCRLDDHNDFRVMYIHSKGSYHPLEVKEFSQTAWRQNMMKAVTGKDCVMPPNGACSVCGLVALPFPMLHFPGNFFTATCDYVKRLVPPAEFGARMNEVVKSARLKHLEGQFGTCIGSAESLRLNHGQMQSHA